MLYQQYTLSNGIRIVHKNTDSSVAHCGVMINAGSRDEDVSEIGLAHFIEHVLFKETKKRKSFHINNRLESIGGEMNAYTTKEETCIYASFLNKYYDRALELFSDILFNSTFPEQEIKKEKQVVIEEINSYKDSPSEQILDDFENMIFSNHPLGHFILGTPKSVRQIKRKDVISFTGKHYIPENMVISSCGNIDFNKLVRAASKYFSAQNAKGVPHTRKGFETYAQESKTIKKKTWQTHCVIGAPGYSMMNQKRFALSLLSNILGGPGMNSRLNVVLREKNGLTYNVESGHLPYSDSGLFHIYFGVDPLSFDKTLDLIHKELKKLRDQKLGTVQLKNAKQQLCGQMAIHFEYNLNEMFSMAKSIINNGEILSLSQLTDILQRISATDLVEISNEVFQPENLSIITYRPK